MRGAAACGVVGPAAWAAMLREPSRASGLGLFNELEAPDALGIRLPPGFTARLVARTGDPVAHTDYIWHHSPDGGACFDDHAGGWWYVSNSEVIDGGGGVSNIRFDRTGRIVGAASMLSGTTRNCAGGATPWGTWLSCEETATGQVWECDPTGANQAILRPGLGRFRHEAAAVDPNSGSVYLTEDERIGRLYRFDPSRLGSVADGQLHAARTSRPPSAMRIGDVAQVTWVGTSTQSADRDPTTAVFDGGEGMWIDERRVLFTTKGDDRVWELDVDTDVLRLLHDCTAVPDTPLGGVDNLTVHPTTGDIVIAEDKGDMQLCVLREHSDELHIQALVQVVGHGESELTGPAFSPDGTRLYFSSQRGSDGRGCTYEVTGPFGQPGERIDNAAAAGPLRPAQRVDTTVDP